MLLLIILNGKAVAAGPTRVALEWAAADGRGAPVTQYRLEMCPVLSLEDAAGAADADAPSFACAWSGDKLGTEVKGLMPNSTYLFRIQVLFFPMFILHVSFTLLFTVLQSDRP